MRVGLHALGIGSGADPAVVTAVAHAADHAGFATLWAGEHVVMVDRPDSRYPYAADGRIAVPSDADWLDPFVALAFAAAGTTRIRLATGVLLLPEHSPLVVAKQAASLDVLSGGRFVLGAGIGWSAAEFAALGIPFADRAQRTREYVEVLRILWRDEVASYSGGFVRFEDVRSYPKPVRGAVPVILGGNSDAALDRVAEYGDGWYGFNLTAAALPERINALRSRCRQHGRDPGDVDIAVSVADGGNRPDVEELEDLGIDELVVVASPPEDPAAARRWVEALDRPWGREDLSE